MISLNACHGLGALVFWFILFTIAAWILLFSLHPTWINVSAADATISYQYLLMYSALIAAGLLVLAYVAQRY